MAKIHKRPHIVAPKSTGTGVMEPPESPESPGAEAEAAAPPPEPPPNKKQTRAPDEPPFWDKISAVPEKEWGEEGNFYIYLYLLEPTNNLKIDGQPGYLMKYFKPIDAHHIMLRFGSGRYHLKFKRKKGGTSKNDTLIADHTFEICNPEYPPKTPVGMWKKDSKNERWLALLPPEKPKGAMDAAAMDPTKMFEVFEKITDRAEARYARDEPDPAPDPADQFNTVVSTAKSLFEMARPAAPSADGTVMEKFLLQQTAAMQKSIDALTTRLLDATTKAATPAAPPVDPIQQLKQSAEVLKSLREEFAPAEGEAVHNSRMNGWQEVLVEALKGIAASPALDKLAQAFLMQQMMKAQPQQNGNGHQAPQPQQTQPNLNGLPAPAMQQQAQSQPAGNPLMLKLNAQQMSAVIGQQIYRPLMMALTDREQDGHTFADTIIKSRGYQEYNWIRSHGVETIMQAFQLSPYWGPQGNGQPALGDMAPQLQEFIEEFCYGPQPPPEDTETNEAGGPTSLPTSQPINLMGEDQEGDA